VREKKKKKKGKKSLIFRVKEKGEGGGWPRYGLEASGKDALIEHHPHGKKQRGGREEKRAATASVDQGKRKGGKCVRHSRC